MANLAITAVCNQDCVYCFTQDHLAEAGAIPDLITMEDFETRLSFLDRSGISQVRLLGGEPTLHPSFPDLVARSQEQSKSLLVFSNGLMPEEALACLELVPMERGCVLINVGHPNEAAPEVQARQRVTLRRLGKRALPGFNIHQVNIRLDFLLSLIVETGCQAVVRLGMAQPCLSGKNRFIHPRQYRAVGREIVRFAQAVGKEVVIKLDCGFVPCMFNGRELEMLRTLGADIEWKCNPILDIDTAGQVIHCYPLARLGSLPLTPESAAPDLRLTFESLTRPYRQAGVYANCSSCRLKLSGECTGGCLAATMRRFRQTPFSLNIPNQRWDA